MCHPQVDVLLHQMPSRPFLLPILSKISFLYTSTFSLGGFFVGHGLLEPSKLIIVLSKALWESRANSSFSIWRTSKNLSQWQKTSYMIFSFMYLSLNHFSTLVRASSSLILLIGQTRPTTYFLHKSLNVKTTITSSWAQTFKVWMGIFLTKLSLSFLMKWNSIKVSYLGVSLAPQINTLFKRLQIPSCTWGYKLLNPKYLAITFFNNENVYLHFKKISKIWLKYCLATMRHFLNYQLKNALWLLGIFNNMNWKTPGGRHEFSITWHEEYLTIAKHFFKILNLETFGGH